MRLIQSRALRHLVFTREGRDPSFIPITDEPSIEMRHPMRTDPDLAWIADQDGEPVGFSVGFVRGELWFLSDLFVLPEAHGKGIGGALLQRCLAGGMAHGARIRAVASSGDPAAQALYIRAGMVPRFPLFGIKGAVRGLCDLPAARQKIARATATATWIRKLGDLDEIVWGRRRDCEHRFWLEESRLTCLAIIDASGRPAAYAYRGPNRLGPFGARSPRLQIALLRAIGDASGNGAAETEIRVPGLNATMLAALLASGFRIDHAGLFMTSRPFGRFDRYVPSGGTLL